MCSQMERNKCVNMELVGVIIADLISDTKMNAWLLKYSHPLRNLTRINAISGLTTYSKVSESTVKLYQEQYAMTINLN